MSEFGGYAYPTARKAHRCEWCGESIPTGEKYVRYTGMWENEFQNWAMHEECNESYGEYDDGEGFSPFDNERPKKTAEPMALEDGTFEASLGGCV